VRAEAARPRAGEASLKSRAAETSGRQLGTVDQGEMNTLGEWADEHWDVLVIAAALALAVAVSGALGVAYNVAAARLDPSAPPASEAITQPPAPAIDQAPAHLITPFS